MYNGYHSQPIIVYYDARTCDDLKVIIFVGQQCVQ
jgi:hypothetical protein